MENDLEPRVRNLETESAVAAERIAACKNIMQDYRTAQATVMSSQRIFGIAVLAVAAAAFGFTSFVEIPRAVKSQLSSDAAQQARARIDTLKSQAEADTAQIRALRQEFENAASVPVGTLAGFVGLTAPEGWLVCDGAVLNPVANPEFKDLATVLGSRFDRSGKGICCLPDFRGRCLIGAGVKMPVLSDRTIGEYGGEEQHVLTIQEMPKHDHGFIDPGHEHKLDLSDWTQNDGASLKFTGFNHGPGFTDRDAGNPHMAKKAPTGITLKPQGSNKPHNNMQPFVVANVIIKYRQAAVPLSAAVLTGRQGLEAVNIATQRPAATGGTTTNMDTNTARLDARVEALEKSWTPLLAVIAAFLSILVAAGSTVCQWIDSRRRHRDGWNLNHDLKSIELAQACVERYNAIDEMRTQDPAKFYNQLWGLHFMEFEYFKCGFLDERLYETWLRFRNKEYRSKRTDEQPHWERLSMNEFMGTEFPDFMNKILNAKDNPEIRRALKQVHRETFETFQKKWKSGGSSRSMIDEQIQDAATPGQTAISGEKTIRQS